MFSKIIRPYAWILLLCGLICVITYFPALYLLIFKREATIITVSSKIRGLGPEGLLYVSDPGWHAQKNPSYPQVLKLNFSSERTIKRISLYPQLGFPDRAPKAIRISYSQDGKIWKEEGVYVNLCVAKSDNMKKIISLSSSIRAKCLRIDILENCGSSEYLTLRGITF